MPEELPAWLAAKVEARVALIAAGVTAAARETDAQVVMTYLDEGKAEMTDEERRRWERTCDNCQRYCPDEDEFYTGHVVQMIDGRQVLIAFGVCGICRHES